MRYIFAPKEKSFKTEKELIYESESPLRQDNKCWYVLDKEGVRHSVKKLAYIIRVEK